MTKVARSGAIQAAMAASRPMGVADMTLTDPCATLGEIILSCKGEHRRENNWGFGDVSRSFLLGKICPYKAASVHFFDKWPRLANAIPALDTTSVDVGRLGSSTSKL